MHVTFGAEEARFALGHYQLFVATRPKQDPQSVLTYFCTLPQALAGFVTNQILSTDGIPASSLVCRGIIYRVSCLLYPTQL